MQYKLLYNISFLYFFSIQPLLLISSLTSFWFYLFNDVIDILDLYWSLNLFFYSSSFHSLLPSSAKFQSCFHDLLELDLVFITSNWVLSNQSFGLLLDWENHKTRHVINRLLTIRKKWCCFANAVVIIVLVETSSYRII